MKSSTNEIGESYIIREKNHYLYEDIQLMKKKL